MSVIIFDEIPDSRSTNSNPPGAEIRYRCAGLFHEGDVKALAYNTIPGLVATAEGILVRDNIHVDTLGHKHFLVIATFKPMSGDGGQSPPLGQYTFSFTTTGGNLHISHSPYPTHAVFNPAGGTVAKDHWKQAIDPEPPHNKPRGTEIVVPTLKLTYTFKHPQGIVNESKAIYLARNTGIVNEEPWHGFDAGEALFIGADGSDGTNTEAELKYHIVAQENLTGLTIGEISGIAKDGHDFLWVWWESTEVSNQVSTKPRAVFIERLYRRRKFLNVFGF